MNQRIEGEGILDHARWGPSGLLSSLGRLDRLLSAAAARVPAVFGAEAATDRFRGLYISAEEVERLLARPPGAPLFAEVTGPWRQAEAVEVESAAAADPEPTRLSWLAATYGLTSFDLDVLVLALASEIDSRYDRVYAYLQDDVTRRRPTVDLALALLSGDAHDRLIRRCHFAADAPLVRERLIELVADPGQSAPTLLAHAIRIDEQVINLLLEQDVLDSRLAPFCRLDPADAVALVAVPPETIEALGRRVHQARAANEALRLEVVGPAGSGHDALARALAAAAGTELLCVDTPGLLSHHPSGRDGLYLAVREAWFRDATLYLTGADALTAHDHARAVPALREVLDAFHGIVVVAAERRLPNGSLPGGALHLGIGAPPPAVRRELWRATLGSGDVGAAGEVLDALSDRFRLTSAQIADAAQAARARASLRSAVGESATPSGRELFSAAADQTGATLDRLATRLRPTTPWSALVLPPDTTAQLRELCDRAIHNRCVFEEWGFGSRLSRGRGVTALFAGPSGTGKTMAAEIIAAQLGVDLWRIELAGVVSKYIGETEKNLDRIFDAAATANGILFFDEAEALFGKRSEVRDSHDRYANLEIAYLLQKMEQHDGLAILATNMRGNLDQAFIRRLAFSVHFPLPDEASRRRIWDDIFPRVTPVGEDVDLDRLSRDVRLSGGHIRNIALAAAFLAATDGGSIRMQHLLGAVRREYQKLGKDVSTAPRPTAGVS